MKLYSKAIVLVAALGLSACSNSDRFGTDGANGANGLNGADAGSVNDPTSPAYFQQTIGDRVLFAVDQHVLTPQATGVLEQQAVWLIANTDYTAVIEGHADEQGTTSYNLALSARRANSVIEYLVDRGIAEIRLRPLPLGKARPIEICSEEACYQQNRRAVTILTAGATS